MKQNNIIWFITDQMRSGAMGVNGDPNVFTPNLDNMAIGGTNFPNAVSGYPLCCPFRASMLTGLYANNHSVKLHEDRLEPSYLTVTDVFNERGYETIYLGKWHLGGLKEGKVRTGKAIIPKEDRGRFDTWLGYENNNSQWDCWVHGHENEEEIAPYRLPDYETDALTDMALKMIDDRKDSDNPFFMVVSVQPPHWPNMAPLENRNYQGQQLTLRPNIPEKDQERARFDLSGYYGQIENIDANMGRLTEALRKSHMLDDTHILFFSDHGDQLGSQGRFGKCVPYEESVKIPFIIGGGKPMSYEGWKAGNVPCLMNHVDIAPTTLGLCGIDVPSWMEGFDYSHRRTGTDFHTRIQEEPNSAYLQLIDDRESGYAWRCVITRDGWKYACVKNGEWLLFNLKDDPDEMNNLSFHTGYRQKRREMNRLIRQWAEKTGDDFPFPGLDD